MVKTRHNVALTVILLYFVPFFSLSAYSLKLLPLSAAWNFAAIGLSIAAFGSLSLFWLLMRWDAGAKNRSHLQLITTPVQAELEPVNSLDKTKSKETVVQALDHEEALHEMAAKEIEINNKFALLLSTIETRDYDIQRLSEEKERLESILDAVYKEMEENRQENKRALASAQSEADDLKSLLESKEQLIIDLETKVSDLNYEIKTLLQLSDAETKMKEDRLEQDLEDTLLDLELESSFDNMLEPLSDNALSSQKGTFLEGGSLEGGSHSKIIHNRQEAEQQLRRCLDIAQKTAAANRYHPVEGLAADFTPSNGIRDLRQLFDSFRSERMGPILFYSHKQRKLLFINDPIKQLIGWSPDKVLQNFDSIVQEGLENWKQSLGQLNLGHLNSKNEMDVALKMRNASGEDLKIHALLAMIPSGHFRQDILAVFYPENSTTPSPYLPAASYLNASGIHASKRV